MGSNKRRKKEHRKKNHNNGKLTHHWSSMKMSSIIREMKLYLLQHTSLGFSQFISKKFNSTYGSATDEKGSVEVVYYLFRERQSETERRQLVWDFLLGLGMSSPCQLYFWT